MPINAGQSTEILGKIIRQKRAETSKRSPDILAYIGSLGADWDRVKKDFIQTNLRALGTYNNALFAQFSQLDPRLDSGIYKKFKSKIEYGTLTHAEIKRYPNLSNAQQLFLHQIINNNRIKKDISLIDSQIKNSPDLNSALSLLQDLYHYDEISHYFADVQIGDPNSFRLFQLLNNYALTQFTRAIYDGTLGDNEEKLAKTIKDLIKSGIDAIKESDETSIVRRNKHSVEGFQEQLTANVMSAIKKFFKSSEDEHNEIVDAIRRKIPSLLQISFDDTNFANLKIRINELIDLEKTVPGFTLTADFFAEYIQACYQSGVLGAREQAQVKIATYIVYIRNLRSKAGEIAKHKQEKIRLTAIQDEVQKLWLKELCSSKLLSVEKQDQLRPILEKLSDTAVKKLIDLLVDNSDFIRTKKGKIDDFLRAYNLQDNAGLLFNLLKIKFDEQHTTIRAGYYHNLLKGLSHEIAAKESAIADYVDSIADHASAILQNADVFDDLLLDGDYLSIMLSKFYNPLDNKLKKSMPSKLTEVLKNLSAIKKEVSVVSKVIAAGREIQASYTADARSQVKDSYSRLETLRKSLVKKHDLLASNLIDLLSEEISGLLQQQVEQVKADYDSQANRWFGAISVQKRRALDKSLATSCKKLSEKLATIKKAVADFQERVNKGENGGDSIGFYLKDQEKLRESFYSLEILIRELETKNLDSSYKFDFNEIKGRLKLLKDYYNSGGSSHQRVALASSPHKQDGKIEFKSKDSYSKTIIRYAWWAVQALKWLVGICRIIAAFVRAVLYAGFVLYRNTLGVVIFTAIGYFSNKKVLFQEIDELYDKVDKLHSSKIKAISARKLTDPDDPISRAQLIELADLKERIEVLKNHSHYLLTKTTQMIAECQKLQAEFSVLQTCASSGIPGAGAAKVGGDFKEELPSVRTAPIGASPTASHASDDSSPLSSPVETSDFIAALLTEKQAISDISATVEQKCYKEFLSKSKQDISDKFAKLNTEIDDKIHHYASRKTEVARKNKQDKSVSVTRQEKRVDLQLQVLQKLKRDLERLNKSSEYRAVSAKLGSLQCLSETKIIVPGQLQPIDDFYDKLNAIEDKIQIVSDVDLAANLTLQNIFNIIIGGDENSPLQTILTEKGDKSFAPSLYRRFIDLAIDASSDGKIDFRKLFVNILTEVSRNPSSIEAFTPIPVLKGMQSKIITDAANKALSELNKTDGTEEGDAASLVNALMALRQVLGSSTISKITNAIRALGVTGSLQLGFAGVAAVPVGLVGLACGGVSTVVGSAWGLIRRPFVSSATQGNEQTLVAAAPVRMAAGSS